MEIFSVSVPPTGKETALNFQLLRGLSELSILTNITLRVIVVEYGF